MLINALLASLLVASASLVGVLLFGHDRRLQGIERFVIPLAVGVFLSLVLFELLPETYASAGQFGGIVVAIGFISFYILSSYLHKRFHNAEDHDCEKKNAATLLLIGDSIHNLADGFILGGAFLVDPALGVATAIGLALHEIPQEIVEFGVLLRAGYTKVEAALRNFISALSIVVGTLLVMVISEQLEDYVWILIAIAAGNLLYLATCELLPRIHSNLPSYKGVWVAVATIFLGFTLMTVAIFYTHEIAPHGQGDHATEHGDEADH